MVNSENLDTAQEQSPADLDDEIKGLKAYIAQLEAANRDVETTVRKNFDDILENLREDLQTCLKENGMLQAEIFMLKNMERKTVTNKEQYSVQPSSNGDREALSASHAENSESQSVDVSIQTELNLVAGEETAQVYTDVFGSGRVKSYSSSERLPELVEDSLASKLAFEQLQTYSDSSLEGEAVSDYAKLELRLTDEPLEGEKSPSLAALHGEIETFKSKLEQNNRMIVKLKQMCKKYKNELTELQAEKFEQIRVYEDEIEAVKQEIEEGNQERLMKDHETRSLREEVRVLVKEKSEMALSIKAKVEEVTTASRTTMSELTERNAKETALKDETISILYQVKSDLHVKIADLERKVSYVLSLFVQFL